MTVSFSNPSRGPSSPQTTQVGLNSRQEFGVASLISREPEGSVNLFRVKGVRGCYVGSTGGYGDPDSPDEGPPVDGMLFPDVHGWRSCSPLPLPSEKSFPLVRHPYPPLSKENPPYFYKI